MASETPPSAIPPPPGQVSDFNASNELWKWNVLCQSICLGIPGIMWLLRLYVRIWVKRTWILEDYLSVLSFVGLAAYGGLTTTVFYHHGGVHEWDMQSQTVQSILFWVNAVQIEYGPTAICIKTSILLLYLRVFSTQRHPRLFSPQHWTPLDIGIRLFILIVCLFYTGLTFAKIFQCTPREKIWIASLPGTCVSLPGLLDASGLFNILSDVGILLVPIKGLWKLRLSFKRKIGIYAVFTVGIVGPVFSIIGLVMRFRFASSTDQSYNQPGILLWANAELATGMMIICLPTLPGIFQGRHKRQPSRSILEGSGRSARYQNSYRISGMEGYSSQDNDGRLFRNEYVELSDIHHNFPAAGGKPGTVTNRIEGGYSPPERSSDEFPTPASGEILKTVTLEQRRRN